MSGMKRMLSVILTIVMMLTLTACGGGNEADEGQQSVPAGQDNAASEEAVVTEITPLAGWGLDSVEAFVEKNAPKELDEYYKLRKALNLEHEYVDDENFHYMINRTEKVARVQYYIGPADATEIIVPAEVEGCRVIIFGGDIPQSAASIVFPEGLLAIHGGCYNAKGLTSITFPESLLIIDGRSFNYCDSLKELNLPDSLILINEGFEGIGITELTIPKNTIFVSGFNFCESLTTVNFAGSSLLAISTSFVSCAQLVNCEIPESVRYIRSTAFRETSITIPEQLILAEN